MTCYRLGLALAFGFIAACSGANADNAKKAKPLSASVVEQEIRTVLAGRRDFGVSIASLRRDVPLATTFRRLGYLAGSGKAVRFTALGETRAVHCHFQRTQFDDTPYRCFIVARREFIRLLPSHEESIQLDRSGTIVHPFIYRATPISELGTALAKDRALICHDQNDHPLSWLGARTEVYGALSEPTLSGVDQKTFNVEAVCPVYNTSSEISFN